MSTTKKTSKKSINLALYASEADFIGAKGSVVKLEYCDGKYKPTAQVCGFYYELKTNAETSDDFFVRLVADDVGKVSVSPLTIRKALAYFNRCRALDGLSLYEMAIECDKADSTNKTKYVKFHAIDCKKCYPVQWTVKVSGGDHTSSKAKGKKKEADKQKAVDAVACDSKATIDAVKKADSTTQADALKAIADVRSSTVDFTKIDVKRREDITKFCKSLSDDERAYLLSVLASYKK